MYERLRTYIDEIEAYDRIATVECINEDVGDVIQLAPDALDDTPPKVKDPIEKVNLGEDIEPMEVVISTYLEPEQR